jgi:UDP-N-acetylglucosamine:LPS N-acetylglucosamine transferase
LHEEKNLTPGVLAESVCGILNDEKARTSLSASIQAFAKPNAADDIYKDLLLLSEKEV